jgi:hypothetical protein
LKSESNAYQQNEKYILIFLLKFSNYKSFNWNSHLRFSLCSKSVQLSAVKHELRKFTAPLPITVTLELGIPLVCRYLLTEIALFWPKTLFKFFDKYSLVP